MAPKETPIDRKAEGNEREAASPERRAPQRWRRRTFLVNRHYQLKVTALVVSILLVLVFLLDLSIHAQMVRTSDAIIALAPQARDKIRSEDRIRILLQVVGSVVFLIGVSFISILETHRIAGPAFNLNRTLGHVAEGRYTASLRLRKGDYLKELEPVFNRMCRCLEQQVRADIEALDAMANRLEAEGGRSAEVAEELRALARRKRVHLEG
jgi:nitrogen fixation/metabolism regulation signal transduction histidine kinase